VATNTVIQTNQNKPKQNKIITSIKRQIPGYFFLTPGFLFIFIFMIYPLVWSLYLSFTEYNFAYDDKPVFNGLQNYINMFSDQYFIDAFWNTALFSVLFFPAIMVLGLIIALMLDKGLKATGFFRTSIFLPVVIPLSLTGIIFQWILNEQYGLLNFFLKDFLGLGFMAKNWLGDDTWAMVSIVFVSIWKFIGMIVVLYMAGLQAIPNDIYEAAEVDGASGWKRIIYITLPNLKESYVVCGIWAIIQSVKIFEQPFIMTQGGPGTSTLVLYQYTWENAFRFLDMGYASAIAYVMGIIILLLSLLNLKLAKGE
jgi:multiple sugar transport system permease protein